MKCCYSFHNRSVIYSHNIILQLLLQTKQRHFPIISIQSLCKMHPIAVFAQGKFQESLWDPDFLPFKGQSIDIVSSVFSASLEASRIFSSVVT